MSSQQSAPIHDALVSLRNRRVVPFDVPGHKRGKGNPELSEFLGERCMSVDVNSMKPIDNLCHPVSVIKEAECLAAEAFGASHAFFIVNGTTGAVQSMLLAACKQNDKVILPRNVHKSVINAIILCGAIPVYVNPEVNRQLGIALGMSFAGIREAVSKNPDAKAILVNNPTYYGICPDLRAISALAHGNGMLLLADEAHGAHFYFGDGLPMPSIAAGADMAAVSMHKSGGSLSQSSFLLLGPGVGAGHVRQIINLTQTTSGSYLLLASLDLSRKYMALHGREILRRVCELSRYARGEINGIGGFLAFSREIIDHDSVFDFDETKLSVHTLETGLSGIEVYDILRDEYGIQVEFGDIGNLLAYISIGDRKQDVERLIGAFAEIYRRHRRSKAGMMSQEYIAPELVIMPQQAFYAKKRPVALEGSEGQVCCEFVMCYPPGIPILAPGERVTRDIIDYILYAKDRGCLLTGPEDMTIESINVWEGN